MDLGRARYRQAHRMPPHRWDQALFVFAFLVVILVVVWPW